MLKAGVCAHINFLNIHTYILQNEQSIPAFAVEFSPSLKAISTPNSHLLGPQWDERMRNVLHQVKSVPSLWEQVAISRQACETFLGCLSRLDRGMEGWEAGGSELRAPFVSPSLTPPHKHHSHCSLLSANRQAACQPGRSVCMCVCVCVADIVLVYT